MKTYSARAGDVERRWFVVDADGQVLGRLASRIATVLRGKHKPPFTPHIDVGDFVVVVNAGKVKLTGSKLDTKLYRRHSGYPGGLTEIPYRRLLETHPERAIERAVRGMLPKGRLGRQLRTKLKVYGGPDHPHGSQKPEPLAAEGPIPVYISPEPKRTRSPGKAKAKEARRATAKAAPPKRKPAKRKPGARKASSRKSTKPKET
jgi:large subunit ribosomal protein L13